MNRVASLLRVCNSHGGAASEQASAAVVVLSQGATDMVIRCAQQCFCRLLLALCAAATPETVLGECLAVPLRLWIAPQRKFHR